MFKKILSNILQNRYYPATHLNLNFVLITLKPNFNINTQISEPELLKEGTGILEHLIMPESKEVLT